MDKGIKAGLIAGGILGIGGGLVLGALPYSSGSIAGLKASIPVAAGTTLGSTALLHLVASEKYRESVWANLILQVGMGAVYYVYVVPRLRERAREAELNSPTRELEQLLNRYFLYRLAGENFSTVPIDVPRPVTAMSMARTYVALDQVDPQDIISVQVKVIGKMLDSRRSRLDRARHYGVQDEAATLISEITQLEQWRAAASRGQNLYSHEPIPETLLTMLEQEEARIAQAVVQRPTATPLRAPENTAYPSAPRLARR